MIINTPKMALWEADRMWWQANVVFTITVMVLCSIWPQIANIDCLYPTSLSNHTFPNRNTNTITNTNGNTNTTNTNPTNTTTNITKNTTDCQHIVSIPYFFFLPTFPSIKYKCNYKYAWNYKYKYQYNKHNNKFLSKTVVSNVSYGHHAIS